VKAVAFALRALPRDLRSREMRVLAMALMVAVGALTAVGFFTDRVDRAMGQRATTLIGADLVLESDDPIPSDWVERARSEGLSTSGFVTFPTVVVTDAGSELTSVKAVGEGYPLRGELLLADNPYGEDRAARGVPEPGTAWLDPRLFARLGVAVGDRIQVGQRELRIAASIAQEPDRSGSLFQLAPRLMFNRADLEATGLISRASRFDDHLLVAGEPADVARFRGWIESHGPPGLEVQGVENARPEMRAALERARAFLGLAAIMAVVLAGAAVAVAAHALAAREADASALLRCFGARQRLVLTTLLLRLGVVGLAASAVGIGVGWLAQYGLVSLVGAWFGDALPAPSLRPVGVGLAAGLITLVGFGLVPVLRIRRVPVMRVLQRSASTPEPSVFAALGLAIAALAVLVYYQAGDPALARWILLGTLGMLLVLGLAAAALVRLVGRLRGRAVSGWRFGLANVARRPRTSTVQMVGFGLGLLALLLLAVVRVDVLEAWRSDVPPDAPNQFMVNVQPDDVEAVKARLDAAGIEPAGFYPMVRGRLRAINDDRVEPASFPEGRARRLVEREFNLSWAERHRPENEIVAGEWWSGENGRARAALSVEEGIADVLGVSTGDRMTFNVAGEEITGEITNLRRVQWDSFKVNFFVLATPQMLEGAPATWITSYYAPPESRGEVDALVREFPGVTVLDVDQILEQVRSIIQQGTRAVEYVFVFTLLAGIVVLVAAVQASRDERRVEIALLRTLGASRRRVRSILGAEFIALGGLAGLIAASGAALTGWAVTDRVLNLPYHFNPWLFLLGVGGGGLGIALAGLIATRSLLNERPLAVLRRD
jgi:putative ABC transport system permease protein